MACAQKEKRPRDPHATLDVTGDDRQASAP
jgi:hypothetical protein